VRKVNLAKGRPANQIGSITTAAEHLTAVFDRVRLSPLLDGPHLRAFMAALPRKVRSGSEGRLSHICLIT
jgi:hypothetical protein